MPIPLIVPAAIAGINMIGKFISGAKQTKESKSINPIWQQYQQNPFARKQLETAQNSYLGRSAGAPQLERNIFSTQASRLGGLQRNATDSSQLLSLGAQAQGQTNDALENLQVRELQNKQMMLQNLNQAYGVNIQEGDKEYQSMLQKYGMDVNRKDQLRSSGAQNKYGAVSDLASMGFSMASGGMFGGGNNGGTQQQSQFVPQQGGGVANRLNWMGNQNRRWNPATRQFE